MIDEYPSFHFFNRLNKIKKSSYFLLRRLNDFYKHFKIDVCINDLEGSYISPLLAILDECEIKVVLLYIFLVKIF